MVTKAEILEAWVFLRKHNNSVPDETLDFIKDSAYEKLEKQEKLNKKKCMCGKELEYSKGENYCCTCGREVRNG